MAWTKQDAIDLIGKNIAEHGRHVYVISNDPTPRFSYSIGLFRLVGSELILAGGLFFTASQTTRIINHIAGKLILGEMQEAKFDVDSLGTFELGPVHESWAKEMILGAYDFYDRDTIPALQIKPDPAHSTIDVPNLAQPWSPETEPIWQWLYGSWTLPVPETSSAMTNLAALRGERVTEAARWEEDEWELFAGAGPDVVNEDMRSVPLGTLLAADPSLEAVVSLPIGSGLWREADEVGWHQWSRNSGEGIS